MFCHHALDLCLGLNFTYFMDNIFHVVGGLNVATTLPGEIFSCLQGKNNSKGCAKLLLLLLLFFSFLFFFFVGEGDK